MSISLLTMKTNVWLAAATRQLRDAGVTTARLDCLVLLEDATGLSRIRILSADSDLSVAQLRKLDQYIARRSLHEPLAYIRGKSEFYGNEFSITKHVLEPRPESEAIIDFLKRVSTGNQTVIVDIGTGSGALAITAKLLFPHCRVIAIDIDRRCLDIAAQNSQKHHATIELLCSDLLKDIDSALLADSIVLANLPYVPNDYPLNEAAKHEPQQAIFSGTDGLSLYKSLFQQLHDITHKPSSIIVESLPSQHAALTDIADEAGFQMSASEDFVQLFTTRAQPQE